MSESREARQPSAQTETAPHRILVVEDEALFAKAVRKRLEQAGFTCEVVTTLAAARAQVKAWGPDMLLLDMRLPDGSGMDLLSELREEHASEIPVVVMTAYGELEDAVQAMKLQALDYLKKPVDLDELVLTVEKVRDQWETSRRLAYSREREHRAHPGVQLLGSGEAMAGVREQVQRVVRVAASRDESVPPTVLILGETGTGKDVVARLLHQESGFGDRPFVHVDCTALPKELIEAELFGHEKGAFTNAHAARTGLIEAAENGTLFLDEVGELPLELQSKLLPVLERRVVRRVGSTRERPVRAWFLVATNRSLDDMVAEGSFRSDLYYRINVLTLSMPPLRERGEDVVELARDFARQTARRYGFAEPPLADDALQAMRHYHWPGNVRELKHVVERAVLLTGGGTIGAGDLMLEGRAPGDPGGGGGLADLEGMTIEAAERYLIEQALQRTEGNVSEAARQLGLTRMALRYRMQQYGLSRKGTTGQ